MDKDLDINNYSFQELLNVFHLKNLKADDFTQKLDTKCYFVKENYNSDINTFYMKSRKILECIYNLAANTNSILNSENIEMYLEKIKDINFFENFTTTEIIKRIGRSNDFNKLNQEKNSTLIVDNLNTLDSLNEFTYNTDGRINPSLNNKNNTNTIINSYPNSITAGNLNTIKRITQSQNLNLNSCFRNNYYTCSPTDFQYILPSEINNVVSLRLSSIEIPNAWYLFSHKQKNNSFRITVTADGGVVDFIIVIPDGNYDNESLQLYLNSTYFCDSPSNTLLKNLRFVIDKYNFKSRFVFQHDICYENVSCFSFSLFFLENINDNLMNTTGWILGFRLATYLDINIQIESESLFDGSSDRYIYFCLNDYQYNNNNTNIVGFDKSLMVDDILAKVPMINGKLSLIIYDNSNPLTKTRKYNGPVNIRKFHIKILDKFGSVIDLNYMDFSFTIELETLYENFNFKDVFA